VILCNGGENTFGIFQDVGVPESEHLVTTIDKILVSDLVRCACRVLTAVDLNDDLRLKANKIRDIRPKRDLAPELRSDASRPKRSPELALRVGHI
jgi:hypothetical protein